MSNHIIEYAGKRFLVDTPAKAQGMVQLLAKGLTGVLSDLGSMAADIGEMKRQVMQGGDGNSLLPLSAVGMFRGLGTVPALPTPAPTPQPTVTPSVHRSAVPTVSSQGVDVIATILPGSVDRVIRLVVDFTGPYQGGSNVCVINFGAAYSGPPALLIQQKGGVGIVNLRPLSVTTTGFVLTADNAQGITPEFDIAVIPPNEAFD